MRNYYTLFIILALSQQVEAQSITIDPASVNQFTIKTTGIGLDVINGSSRLGTAIINNKAIVQAHSDEPLVFRTNNNVNNSLAIYNNTLSIGPPIFSPEIVKVSKGRIKFSGNKDNANASGTEFTNASGTSLRSFVGMADDGNILGFWGYGNNQFNLRFGPNSGYLGMGKYYYINDATYNPSARFQVNGYMKVLGLGNPLTERLVSASQDGVLQTRPIDDIYTFSSADFIYRTGSTSLPVDTPYGLFYSSTSSGVPEFRAPVTLPENVTLKLLNAGFVDNSSADLEVCLVRVVSGVSEDILCIKSTGNSANATTLASSFPAGTIFTYSRCFIRARVMNGNTATAWPGNSIKLNRVNLTYSY